MTIFELSNNESKTYNYETLNLFTCTPNDIYFNWL